VAGKPKEAEEKGLETPRKARMRRRGDKRPGKARVAYNRYAAIAASMTDAAPELTQELCRRRRRIETAPKRLEPLFKRRETPARVERSALPWLYGKLLLAALCEAWASGGRFPPARESRPDKERPLWSGRRLAPALAKNTLLESVSLMGSLEKMRRIAALFANFKRKRLPAHYRLLVPK
jgi:hypothetical protein